MNADDNTAREDRVDGAIADYLEALEAGTAPSADEFIAQHPDIAAELRAYFADREQFDRFVSPLGAAALPRAAADASDRVDASNGAAPTIAPGAQQPAGDALGTVRYFGDYELLEEIARGGMGVVYKARQTSLKRIVAIKMILAGHLASQDDVRRFYAEAEAAARLDHPGIVPVFEVGQHQGQHYFSMAFVEGESLAHRVVQGVFRPREAAELAKKIAQAISYAHVEGVIHRDLKPANVLIDKDGQPRVMDFGLAQRVRSDDQDAHAATRLTMTGQILGTPSYMSPEQAAGKTNQVGPLSDVYSLGAILYCLVTGRPPFQAASPLDTLRQVLEQEPVSPRQLNSSVPRDLETICLKCLEREPRQRYASTQELVDDLQRFLSGEPIHARPIHAVERSWRWLKKQKRSAVVGATGALAAVVLVVAGYAAWRFHEQSQLAYLQLKSGPADGQVLTAELFDDHDEPAAAPFTAPTKEAVPLAAGSYRLRISGSGSLSETFLLDAEPGNEQSFTVTLNERKLADPVRVRDLERVEIADLDGGPDFIFPPQEPKQPVFRRLSGATDKPVWEVNLSPDAPAVAAFVKPEDQVDWGTFSGWNISDALRKLRLVKPIVDLDGDGVGDLVWVCPSYIGPTQAPVLVAMSGKDGKPLWWARQKKDANEVIKVIGMPLVAAVNDAPTLIAEFTLKGQSWIEAFSGRTGESLWRFDFDPKWIAITARSEPYEPRLCRVNGRDVVATVAWRKLIGVDAATGQPAWPPHDLDTTTNSINTNVVDAPRFGDLDGDGSDEILLVEERTFDPAGADVGLQLRALSLATRQTLWQTRVMNVDSQAFKISGLSGATHSWPIVADLDGDGKAEVIVPILSSGATNPGWHGVEVLSGTTGERRWERRFPISGWAAPFRAEDRYAIGPDLDGDGCREVFMVSARADLTERGGDSRHPSKYSLFVDALSGKDGRPIWWSRIPLGDMLPTTNIADAIGPMTWGPPGPDGRPSLVVSVATTDPDWYKAQVSRSVFCLSASSGRMLHAGQDLWPPVGGDFNRDGITDLCSFVPDNPKNSPGSETLENPAGRFVVFRGTPPEQWRRLGGWETAADFDGDGQPELFKAGTPECIVAAGSDGRIVARWNIDWGVDGIQGHDQLKYPLSLPRGDLNGDGVPDVLLAATHQLFDQKRNRTNVNQPGRLFFPLQAISGKTGQRLWLAGDIPDPCHGNHAFLHVKTYSPTCEVLDPAAPGPDVLCPFSCYMLGPGPGFPRQLGLARFSGSDGTLRWTQMLEDEIALNTGGGGIATNEFTPPIATQVVDLNGDGVADVIVTAALRPDHGVEVQALDGRDGKRLWRRSLARQWNADAFPNVWPQPACGDLDGDGRPEVVVVESGGVGGEFGIWTQYKVTALDGQTGEPKWTWLCANPSRSGDPIGESDWPRAVLADLDGEGHASVCVGVQDRGALEKPAIVVLDHRGEVRARYEGEFRFWAADLDGDGRDELLYVADGKVRATRGGADKTVWEWPLPGGAGGILEVRPVAELVKVRSGVRRTGILGNSAMVVVEAAGEATIDGWARVFLDSLPPQQRMGAGGDSIFGLDGATGKPIWRGRRDPSGIVSIPSPIEIAAGPAKDNPPAMQLAALVSRTTHSPTDQQVVSRAVLPTEPSGQYRLPAPAPVVASAAADPRLLRRLPWTRGTSSGGVRQFAEFVRPPATFGLFSLVVLVIPAWLMRGMLRRRWTLASLLLVPVAVGVAIAGYNLTMALGGSDVIRGPLATLMGLPVLAFPAFAVLWTVRGRWWRLAAMLAAAVAISLVIPAVAIYIDSRDMDPAERYSTNGAYLIAVVGCYGAGLLAIVAILVAAMVRAIRGWWRRPATAA